MHMNLSETDIYFANKAIRRKKLFFRLSITSVIVALSLTAFYTWQYVTQAGFAVGVHAVLVLMILLTARLNLRQYRYAKVLEKLIPEKEATNLASFGKNDLA